MPVQTAMGENAIICSDQKVYEKRRLAGDQTDNLCEVYKGKVVLVVNTASKCAFTPQYDGLEKLYRDYSEKGLVVIGFPSNDFGNQEPGTEKTIQDFCRLTYGVEFPMYTKTVVKGEQADPFYKALAAASGQAPKWNFHKYLLSRDGRLVGSFSSFVKPQSDELVRAIEAAL
ncbi:MAG: glutathione peroxidase [Sedimenticola sp.]|nr:MAG: glutathione peroxidase [Sedimenticola sp.]